MRDRFQTRWEFQGWVCDGGWVVGYQGGDIGLRGGVEVQTGGCGFAEGYYGVGLAVLEVVGDVAEGSEVEFGWGGGFGGEEGDVGRLEAFGLEVGEEFEVEVAVVAGDVDAWW